MRSTTAWKEDTTAQQLWYFHTSPLRWSQTGCVCYLFSHSCFNKSSQFCMPFSKFLLNALFSSLAIGIDAPVAVGARHGVPCHRSFIRQLPPPPPELLRAATAMQHSCFPTAFPWQTMYAVLQLFSYQYIPVLFFVLPVNNT